MAFATMQWIVSFAIFLVVMSIIIWSVVYLAKKHSGQKDPPEAQEKVVPRVKLENLERVCKTLINLMEILPSSINSVTKEMTSNDTKYSMTSNSISKATVYSTTAHSTTSTTSTTRNVSLQTYKTRASIKTSPKYPLPTQKSTFKTRRPKPTKESQKKTTIKYEMSSISPVVSGNSSVIRRAINNTFIQKPTESAEEEIENNPNIEFGDPDVSIGVRNHTDSWNVLPSDLNRPTDVYNIEKSIRNINEKDDSQNKILEDNSPRTEKTSFKEKHSVKILTDEPIFRVIPMKEEELLPDTIIPAFPLDFMNNISNFVPGECRCRTCTQKRKKWVCTLQHQITLEFNIVNRTGRKNEESSSCFVF